MGKSKSSSKVASHLEAAPQTDPTISGLDWHKQCLDDGKTRLFGVYINGEHKASMLCCVYEADNGAEFIVEVIGGDDGHAGVMDGLSGITELAKQASCQVVRFNTSRKGLAHIAEQNGYKLSEFVLRKEVE